MTRTRRDHPGTLLALGLSLSLLLHALGYVALPAVARLPAPFRGGPDTVDFAVQRPDEPEPPPDEPEPPPDEPEPPPDEPEPPPEPREPAEPQPQQPEAPPEPAEPEPAPEQEAPVPFDGEIMSGEEGTWSAPETTGDDRKGPLPAPGRATGRERRGQPTGAPGGTGSGSAPRGPRVVPVGDLSRPPAPPDLNARLQANYPRRAKAQGVEGVAVVRARIGPDGAITRVRIESESVEGYGFGRTCQRTLREGGRWSPPLDERGKPVATRITYTCRFRVRY